MAITYQDAAPKPKITYLDAPEKATYSGGGTLRDLGVSALSAASSLTDALIKPPVRFAAGLAGKSPDAAEAAYDANVSYRAPEGTFGRFVGDLADKGLGAIGKGAHALDTAAAGVLPESVNKGIDWTNRNITGPATDLLGSVPVLGAGVGAVRKAMSAASRVSRLPVPSVPNTPVEKMAAMGVRMRPSDVSGTVPGGTRGVGSTLAKAVESVSGSQALGKEYSFENAPQLQSLAARAVGTDLGSSGGLFTADKLKELRQQPNSVYQKMAGLPVLPQGSYGSGMYEQSLRNGLAGLHRGTTTQVKADIESLYKDYANPSGSRTMVNDVLSLRAKGFKNIGSEKVDANELGKAQLKIADIMDDELERRASYAGKSNQLANWPAELRGAREQLAKLHTIEESQRGGMIDTAQVYRMKKNGAPLTGEMDMLAYIGEHAPNVAKSQFAYSQLGSSGLANADLLSKATAVLQTGLRNLGGRQLLEHVYQRQLGPRAAASDFGRGGKLAEFYKDKTPPPEPLQLTHVKDIGSDAAIPGEHPMNGPFGDSRTAPQRTGRGGTNAGVRYLPTPGQATEDVGGSTGMMPVLSSPRGFTELGAPRNTHEWTPPLKGGADVQPDLTASTPPIWQRPAARPEPPENLPLAQLLAGDLTASKVRGPRPVVKPVIKFPTKPAIAQTLSPLMSKTLTKADITAIQKWLQSRIRK